MNSYRRKDQGMRANIDKKAARAAYKERRLNAGVFIVRCGASARSWVGAAPDLAAVENKLWFALRTGGAANAQMRADWLEHTHDAFAFEVLETVDPEKPPLYLADHLKERAAHWRDALKADSI
jgi:hypothetical protein